LPDYYKWRLFFDYCRIIHYFAVPCTDSGARHCGTALQRWLVPDPLCEKYYGTDNNDAGPIHLFE
jgi:hypothetical protein